VTGNRNEAVYRQLVDAAKQASELAYCAYSHYPVGAAVLSFDGKIYTGCNVENCGYTQTIHAEQTAMATALSEGALHRALAAGHSQLDFISAIAIYAPKGKDPWPCCNCRQSLNEFGLTMDVIGEREKGDIRSKTLDELIPFAFPMEGVLEAVHGKDWRELTRKASLKRAEELGKNAGAIAHLDQSDKRARLIEAARKASGFAYCPYSNYPVGAAILTFDGEIYTGCNIENCGYTQTIHAEQVALAKAVAGGALKRAKASGLTQFDAIESIAVFAPKGAEPWPSCNGRQSLNEFGLKMSVIGLGKNGEILSKKLEELIPFAFPMEVVMASVHSTE
jgi:cytidine deaminase